MAELNKTDLKAIFKAGAVPTEAQFASLIDSQINTVDTSSQAPTGSSGLVESSVLSPAQGFFNLRSTQPFIGLITTKPTTGSGMSMHAGLISNIGQPYPNNPFIKTNGGFDIFMDNANQGPLGDDTQTEPLFRVYRGTALAGIPPGVELLELSQQGGLKLSGSITASGAISASGTVTAGSITADSITGTSTTFTNVTASGAISASGNLIVGGTSALNGDITIPKLVKLYFGGTSGMHVYSEGTATDENQIILAKTNNLRILNQAHGKDIIFGTENASGTAKTPLTLSSSGDSTFGGNVTVTGTTTFTSAQVGQRLTKRVLTTTNETLTAAESGKLCLFSDADGATAVLPDSGNGSLVGVYYDFYVAEQLTSGNYNIKCTDTTNEAIIGFLHFCDIDTNPAVSEFTWRALASDSYDQIQMNGTTTGTVGTFFRITNIAPDKWMVNGSLMATGTPATPFVAN